MTGIELTARHIRLDWLLHFTKLTVSIDGMAQVFVWGTHVIPAAAGTHTLDVSYGYLGKQRGQATLDVPVVDGRVTRVSYSTPPWWMFAKGKMSITP